MFCAPTVFCESSETSASSCPGRASTHLGHFQWKSDLSLQSHLGSGTSHLSLQFFPFFNCCFALVSVPCHCPLRSGWDDLAYHYTHITHDSPNGSDPFHYLSEHVWRLGFCWRRMEVPIHSWKIYFPLNLNWWLNNSSELMVLKQ